VRGIACDPEYEVLEDVSRLTHELHQLTDGPRGLSPEELELYFGAVGPGYGVPSKECIKAIRYLAKREGIFLDPVYSGKAFAGLMDLARTGELHGRVLFWHTGGLPALFAYERAFDARSSEAK
jgi:1-aminocyclopropane-1-carboxylate deaminase/D-cysteine desulfhydrase-like pyridoxal-dependent ACC family enzyme